MRITVAKGAKLNPAPPVTERLLSTQQSMTERGKTELYDNGQDVNNHSIDMPLQALVLTGRIVQIQDVEQGEVYAAKSTSTRINISDKGITQTIAVERPL